MFLCFSTNRFSQSWNAKSNIAKNKMKFLSKCCKKCCNVANCVVKNAAKQFRHEHKVACQPKCHNVAHCVVILWFMLQMFWIFCDVVKKGVPADVSRGNNPTIQQTNCKNHAKDLWQQWMNMNTWTIGPLQSWIPQFFLESLQPSCNSLEKKLPRHQCV